jgi:uncharacterized protein (DUF885 family)
MNPIVALTCALALSTSCAHEWKNAEPSRTLSALESEISTSQKLKRLAQEFWQHTLSTSPVWATFIGNRQYDHLLPDISVQAIEADYAFGETLLTRVKEINKSELNEYEGCRPT